MLFADTDHILFVSRNSTHRLKALSKWVSEKCREPYDEDNDWFGDATHVLNLCKKYPDIFIKLKMSDFEENFYRFNG